MEANMQRYSENTKCGIICTDNGLYWTGSEFTFYRDDAKKYDSFDSGMDELEKVRVVLGKLPVIRFEGKFLVEVRNTSEFSQKGLDYFLKHAVTIHVDHSCPRIEEPMDHAMVSCYFNWKSLEKVD